MPAKKWTYQTVLEISKQYKTRKEFQHSHKGAYLAAVRGRFLDDVCTHMQRLIRADLTKEQVISLAQKFRTRREFQKGDGSAYNAALNNGWNEAFAHMELLRKTKTKDEIATRAKQYRTRTEFAKNSWPEYLWAKRRGWLDDVCEGMEIDQHAPYTKEEVIAIAKKFKTRSDFQLNHGGAYNSALRGGYLDEICSSLMGDMVRGFDNTKGAWLYQICLHLESGTALYKVGITNTEITSRITRMGIPSGIRHSITNAIWYEHGSDAKSEEKRLHTKGKSDGVHYKGLKVLRNGNSELFYEPLIQY